MLLFFNKFPAKDTNCIYLQGICKTDCVTVFRMILIDCLRVCICSVCNNMKDFSCTQYQRLFIILYLLFSPLSVSVGVVPVSLSLNTMTTRTTPSYAIGTTCAWTNHKTLKQERTIPLVLINTCTCTCSNDLNYSTSALCS